MESNSENVKIIADLTKNIENFDKYQKQLTDEFETAVLDANQADDEFNELSQLLKSDYFHTKINQISDNFYRNASFMKIQNRIRQLYLAEENIKTTVKFVDDLIDLQLCSESVEKYILNKDYDEASRLIQRYLKIDKNSLQELYPSSKRQSELNISIETINRLKIKLQQILESEFVASIKTKEHENVLRFFKLLSMVGSKQKGLSLFSEYLSNNIFLDLEKSKKSFFNSSEELRPVLCIGKFFQILAANISRHQPIINTYYGPGDVIYVVRELHSSSSTLLKEFLDEFCEKNNVKEKLHYTHASYDDSSDLTSNLKKNIVWNFDSLLQSCSTLLINFSTYRQYLKNNLHDVVQNLVVEDLEIKKEKFLNHAVDHQCMVEIRDEILNIYSNLEKFFMKATCHKAFQMNTIQKSSFTSTVVDDVFYVIKKCFLRSAATLTPSAVDLILDSVDRFLLSEYIKFIVPAFDRNVTHNQVRKWIDNSMYMEGEKGGTLKWMIVMANDLMMSANNHSKFVVCVKSEMNNRLMEFDETKFLKNGQKFVNMCRESRFKVYSNLTRNGFRPLFRDIIGKLHNEELVLSEIIDCEVHELSAIHNLVTFVNKGLIAIKKILVEDAFEEMISLFIEEVTNLMEKEIKFCKLNRFGGICLKNQLRLVINCFSKNSKYFVRQHFNRLNKICNILSTCDTDYTSLQSLIRSSCSILDRDEIMHFLSLRTDIREDPLNNKRNNKV